jgi:hypothetical protein
VDDAPNQGWNGLDLTFTLHQKSDTDSFHWAFSVLAGVRWLMHIAILS